MESQDNIIKYYDRSYACKPDMHLFNIDNKHQVFLSDFSFEHDGKMYFISLGRKGNNGNYYRFNIGKINYVSDNVWYSSDGSDPEIGSTIEKISHNEINKDDVHFNIDSVPDKNKLIGRYVKEIKKEQVEEAQKKSAQDDFWSNAEVLMSLMDDGGQYIYYILRIGDEYHFLLATEGLIEYMHTIWDDYVQKSSNSLIEVVKFLIKFLRKSLNGYASPLSVKIASNDVYNIMKREFDISEFQKTDLNKRFAKEMSHAFEIEFDDSNDIYNIMKRELDDSEAQREMSHAFEFESDDSNNDSFDGSDDDIDNDSSDDKLNKQ
jgi:hypothetical protein